MHACGASPQTREGHNGSLRLRFIEIHGKLSKKHDVKSTAPRPWFRSRRLRFRGGLGVMRASSTASLRLTGRVLHGELGVAMVKGPPPSVGSVRAVAHVSVWGRGRGCSESSKEFPATHRRVHLSSLSTNTRPPAASCQYEPLSSALVPT